MRSRASRWLLPVTGVLLAVASQRHPRHGWDEGPPPERRRLELDAADQDLDAHLHTDRAGPCTLTGCPVPASRYRNQVPWCDSHYENGEAILHLEQTVRLTNA